jgi:hypothetical protein
VILFAANLDRVPLALPVSAFLVFCGPPARYSDNRKLPESTGGASGTPKMTPKRYQYRVLSAFGCGCLDLTRGQSRVRRILQRCQCLRRGSGFPVARRSSIVDAAGLGPFVSQLAILAAKSVLTLIAWGRSNGAEVQ